jgi:hypothetical protein
MGEHKIPKATPKRPSMSIFNMKSAVEAFRPFRNAADDDERAYMDDTAKLLAWIEELEAATDPFAAIVPLIDPTVADETPILAGLTPVETGNALPLTVGAFRRLNPEAVAAAAKPAPEA